MMTGRDHFNPRVMDAMRQVPREDFVPADMRHAAFRDGALPVGHGQTISQPYIVALMTDLLDLTEDSVVLEIGTGTGYQAAILSQLVRQVYTIEKIPQLAQAAQRRLGAMGYDNVEARCSDGYLGWPEKAPFDGIVVTAAAADVPPALLDQLGPGGRLVIPVGLPYMHQELILITRDQHGETERSSILGVAFVPLVKGA
jgi:protein-L-isoaspartate(D-aspartate) O-methyltransferase